MTLTLKFGYKKILTRNPAARRRLFRTTRFLSAQSKLCSLPIWNLSAAIAVSLKDQSH
jgi:hypothetical protein